MKLLAVVLALVCVCEARPGKIYETLEAMMPYATPYEGIDSFVIGGTNAQQGEFPWQLSQQRLSGTSWGHSCGASLLSQRYGLSAAHCVDGASATNLRVIAGLHDRSNTAGTTTANIASYRMHEQYNNGQATYANDIAILTFSTNINTVAGRIAYATLPANNNNNFAGQTCVITGWGRTSSSNTLPNVLQKASITILTTAQCQQQGSSGVWANHICIRDNNNQAGACNGDSGGPCNCPSGSSYLVTGIASFVWASGGNCLTTRPSVYTRVSTYLQWITNNTP
jgi:secreted trypsin-like serine protease